MNRNITAMDMNPEMAEMLFERGAVLILTGVPTGTEFGIDLSAYTVGEHFRGIKMIPPGPHYVYCAARGTFGDTAPPVGFLHFFKPFEILVREWDPKNEELRERQISDPELEKNRIRENLKNLDKYLGAYDYRYLKNWWKLTDLITEESIERCSPECGVVRAKLELMSCTDLDRPRGPLMQTPIRTNRKTEDDLLPNLKPLPGTIPRLVKLPNILRESATPAELSLHHMDSINAIEKIMDKFPRPINLIEDIEISFVMFLVGYSVESLAHWRKLLGFLSNSETAIGKYMLFYMKYLDVLGHQIPNLPDELLPQNERNTLYKDVRKLVLNTTLCGLSVNAKKLEKSLKKSVQWEFQGLLDEDPDDMPVVVETK